MQAGHGHAGAGAHTHAGRPLPCWCAHACTHICRPAIASGHPCTQAVHCCIHSHNIIVWPLLPAGCLLPWLWLLHPSAHLKNGHDLLSYLLWSPHRCTSLPLSSGDRYCPETARWTSKVRREGWEEDHDGSSSQSLKLAGIWPQQAGSRR